MKTLFISCCDEDQNRKDALLLYLRMDIKNGLLKPVETVAEASIVLALCTPHYVSDDRTLGEAEEARKRQKAGECRLIPVMMRAVPGLPDCLALLQPAIHGRYANNDDALADVAIQVSMIAKL